MTEATLTDAPDPGDATRSGSKRTAIVIGVAVAVAAVLGGSAFAIYRVFFNGGPQPAEVLPADTLAVVSIDLNPSAKQKIAAIKTIRKFPSLKEELGLDADDDLRKFIFEKATEGGDCKDLDYAKDVEPWLGKRAAFAAVDAGGDEPSPVLAVQITDADKAKAGVDKLVECGDEGEDFGYATTDDYLVVSDSVEHAKKVVADGKKAPLSSDAAYQEWTDKAGDAGVINFYVAKAASQYFLDNVDELLEGEGEEAKDQVEFFRGYLEDFAGAAGTVRFAGGGVELSAVGTGTEQLFGGDAVGKQSGQLPSDTALVYGLSVPEGFVDTLFDSFRDGLGSDADAAIEEAEDQTGLELPEDVETLLGESLLLALGGDAPASLEEIEGPGDVPAGLLVEGNADEITAIIERVEERVGYSLSDIPLVLEKGDGEVALATSAGYAQKLLDSGDLGDGATFQAAVPEWDKAGSVVFVDFDSEWFDTLVESSGSLSSEEQEVVDNLRPLRALGVSTWLDGGDAHILVKVSTN